MGAGEAGAMRAAFRALAAIFACASAYHVYALVSRVDPNSGRHATFAVINAFVALLMIRRPPGFAIAFALLCGQQLAGHGGDLVRAFGEGRVDWVSLAVVVLMPFALVLLMIDGRSKRAAP
jgi:hypothetical protein